MKKINVMHLFPSHEKSTLASSFTPVLDKKRYNLLSCYLGSKNFESDAMFLNYQEKKQRRVRLEIIKHIAKIVQENSIDILHTHSRRTTFYASAVSNMINIPTIVYTVHSLNRTRTFRAKLTNLFSHKPVSKIIAVSKTVKDDILSSNWVDDEKVEVICNGINVKQSTSVKLTKTEAKKRVSPEHSEKLWIGTAARLVPTKGQSYLVEAFAELLKKRKNLHLIFAGDGRLEGELTKQAEKLGILDNITFLGYFENVSLFLKSLDIFAFPSLAEGLPKAPLEAMACGVPVVVTRVGGIPEIFKNNEDIAQIIEPKNSKQLFKALENLISMDQQGLYNIGEKSKRLVFEDFNEITMLASLTRLYEQLYKENGAALNVEA